jgi:hypothetical protein
MVVLRSKKNVSKTRAKTRSRSRARANIRSRTKTNFKSKSRSRTRKFMRGGANAPPKFGNTGVKPDLGSGSVRVKTGNSGTILSSVKQSYNPPSNATLKRQQRLVSGVNTSSNQAHPIKIDQETWRKATTEAQKMARLGQQGVGAATTSTGLPKVFGVPVKPIEINSKWTTGWTGSRPAKSGTGEGQGRVTGVGPLQSNIQDIYRIVGPGVEKKTINTSAFAKPLKTSPAQKIAEQVADQIQVKTAPANNIVFGFDPKDLEGYQQEQVKTMIPPVQNMASQINKLKANNEGPYGFELQKGPEELGPFGFQPQKGPEELGPFGFGDPSIQTNMNASRININQTNNSPPEYTAQDVHPYLQNKNLTSSDVKPKDTGYVLITDNNSKYERQMTPFNSTGKRGLSGTTENNTKKMNKAIKKSIGEMQNKHTVLIKADNKAATEKGENYVYTRRTGNTAHAKPFKRYTIKGIEQNGLIGKIRRKLYKLTHPSNSKKKLTKNNLAK